jgi:hypothetical protein
MLIMGTDFLLYLDKLMCEEERENKYLLPVFVPAHSELSTNLELLDKPCRQTKIQPLPTLLILSQNRSIYKRQIHMSSNTDLKETCQAYYIKEKKNEEFLHP